MRSMRPIAINRKAGGSAVNQVVSQGKERLDEGRWILIFPEGTRRAVGAPPAYKYGVTHLYTTLNARVMPVALNTGLFWPRRSFLRKPGTAVIEFLPVIEPGLSKEAFSEKLQAAVESGTERLVEEALRFDPALAMAAPARNSDSGAPAQRSA